MQTYSLKNANGYIVMDVNGTGILVDIGSPITFANPNVTADICGVHCTASSGLMAMMAQASGMAPDMGRLSQETGTSVSMLLGNDCLSQLKFLIDVPNGKITFDTKEIPCNGSNVPLKNMMNYLLINANINGIDQKVFIDSGAPISYIDGALITPNCRDGFDRIDYSPLYGTIKSHTKFVPITIAGKSIDVECGPMTGMLEAQITMIGANGVIGGAIFSEHQVYFDIEGGIMKID